MMTLLVLMRIVHGTMAGTLIVSARNAAISARKKAPRLKCLRNDRAFTLVGRIMAQYNSLRLFQRTIHQLYIRVQNHVGIFDFLESGIANPHATRSEEHTSELQSPM